jgi:large subunit ribosomal protein L18
MKRSIRRRRRESKTDYGARLMLLKSQKPRLVIRKTNRYIIAQIVVSSLAQDKVMFNATSKELIAKGWPQEKSGSLKSLPAAYLTGYLIGKIAKTKVKEVIADLGINRNIKKSRIYAVVKGAVDAGLIIPHDPKGLPEEEKISGSEGLGELVTKIKPKL